jgi:hypothetical protein
MLGEEAELVHQEYVNNIGSTTLVRYNQELGNKSFADTKATYAGQSGLQLSQNCLLDQEIWDADAIRRRQDYVIDLIIGHILDIPSCLSRASNWGRLTVVPPNLTPGRH